MFKHIYIAYRTHFIPPFLPATYKHTITRNSINNSKFYVPRHHYITATFP